MVKEISCNKIKWKSLSCVPCKKSVSYAHQGLSDLTAHFSDKIHKSFEGAIKTTQNLSSLKGFETEPDANLAGQTIGAEVMHTNFMVQHNISFLTGEHLSPLYAHMFPDSKIAKNIVSVGLDNTNANIGNKNSIKSRILEKNASCFIAGCNCHLSHLAAGRGGSAYSAVSGFDCQDFKLISTISSVAARGVKVYSQNILSLLD